MVFAKLKKFAQLLGDNGPWTLRKLEVPFQKNGYDCGVFACMYADYLASGTPMDFSQSDIPVMRSRMLLALLMGSLD